MAFSADLPALKELYLENARDMFALCCLYGAPKGRTFALMRTALEDLYCVEKLWRRARQGPQGFLRAVQQTCDDYYAKDPFGRKKSRPAGEAGGGVLPFPLTDSLRDVLRLPGRFKTPLYLCAGRGWSPEQAAKVTGSSPGRVRALERAALKKSLLDREEAAAVLGSLQPGEEDVRRVWDRFAAGLEQPGFLGKLRARRLRRGLDNAAPFAALGIVALAIAAYLGVELGWFTGQPYAPSQAAASQGSPASAPGLPAGQRWDLSVYVPEGDGFVEYLVHNTPQDLGEILRQMVLLGGAPEGAALLSSQVEDLEDGGLSLTLELSEEASAMTGEQLWAMAATLTGYSPAVRELSLRCQGEELAVNGKTAQDFLGQELTVTRTVETDYRE